MATNELHRRKLTSVTTTTNGATLTNITWQMSSTNQTVQTHFLIAVNSSFNSSSTDGLASLTLTPAIILDNSTFLLTTTSIHSSMPLTEAVNRTSLNQSKTSYDSKGAAYYICSVILVYALAIVLLVISLARRKRKDQYQPASQRSHSDEYYIKTKANGIQDGQLSDTSRCSIKGLTFGHSMTSENLDNFEIYGGEWNSLTSSIKSMKQQSKVNKIIQGNKTSSFDSILRNDFNQKHQNFRFYQPESNEEVLTLVQVLPGENKRSSPAGSRERIGSALSPLIPDKRGKTLANTKSCLNKSYPNNLSKCRWSMGPDGNIWILQLPENISSPMENWYEQKHSSKFTPPRHNYSYKPLSTTSTHCFNSAIRPSNLNLPKPLNSLIDLVDGKVMENSKISLDQTSQPLWQYQEGHIHKDQGQTKVNISTMYEKYETSPSKLNSRKQGLNGREPRYTSNDTPSKQTIASDYTKRNSSFSYSNGTSTGGSVNKHKIDTRCCFHDSNRSLKNNKKPPCHETESPDLSLQKLIHVTSV